MTTIAARPIQSTSAGTSGAKAMLYCMAFYCPSRSISAGT